MSIPLHTLVLEDQLDDFKLLMNELRRAGFDPTGERVDTAEEFLAHLDPKLDVILSDFTMPGFNGLEALRLMKQRKIDVPFIFVSGTMGEEIAVTAMQEGAADYLIKDRLGRLGTAVKKTLSLWRLKEEKELAEQTAARLAAIVESSADAIIATTLEGVVVTWNKAAERLYGYSAEEIVGKNISILLPSGRRQNDLPEDHHHMSQMLRNGEMVEAYETVRVRKDGRRVDVSVSISPIRDADGVLGASFIVHDITQRKRAERFLAAEHAVTRILIDSCTLEEASAKLLQALAESLRWEAAVLWKVDSEVGVLRRVHTWHASWAESSFVHYLDQPEILEPEVGVAGRAWARGEPIWEPLSVTSENGLSSGARTRAAISIPMQLEGQMVGAIEFYNPELRQPDAPMLAALANIATQISQFSERRRSESSLRASEERYRTLIAATAVIVWSMPASGEFETEQQEWGAFTGQTFDQLRGWGWLDAVHPEDQENTSWLWLEASKKRTAFQIEHRLRRKDGEYRHMSVRAVPIVEPGGAIREWVGVHTDVTEQKQAEEARSLLAAIVESSDAAIISTTPDGIVTSWNPASERLFGWTVEEAVGRHISFLAPANKTDEFACVLERLRQGEHVEQLETVRLCRDGTRIEVSITASPIRGRDGRLTGVSKVTRDITERKQAQAAVRASEARFRALVESSWDGISMIDATGTILYASPACTRAFGHPLDEYIGRNAREFDHPDDPRELMESFARLAGEPGSAMTYSYRHRHRDGSWRLVEAVATNLLADPDVQAFVINSRDVTVTRAAEEALRDSEQRLRHQTRIFELILANMSDGVVVADERGKFVLFNPAAEQILRQGAIDAQPEEWSARYSLYLSDGKSPYPASEIPLARALRGEHADDVEMIVNHDRIPEGRWISVSARPMHDETGLLRGGIAVFRDITEKKRAENALKTSEQRYRTLIDATAAIVWDSPASGEFDSVQPGWTAFTGQTVEQHRHWGWLNVIHPDDREASARAWRAAVNGRGTYQVEHRLRRADGEYRHMFVRAIPIFGSDGAVREWVGAHTDVTDQKRAEGERAELLTQLTIQIERMPLAYLLSGPDFRYSHWNPAAERMFGYSTAEVRDKHPFETIVPPQSQVIVAEIFARLATGDMNAHGMCENVAKDGTTIICEWHNTPLFGPDGAFQGFFSLAQDVTKRRHADQAVRDTQNRLNHVLASSPAVLFTLAIADNQIHAINWISDNVREMLGYSPEEASTQGWWVGHMHPEEREAVISRTVKSLFGEGTSISEYRRRHRNGEYLWIRGEIRLIRDETGVPVEAVGAWSDITAHKLLAEQYHQAQKMEAFGQLAGGVAHDFNNLLTIINGYSEVLLRNLPQGNPSRKLVTEIHKAGERSAGLTRQLLAFSRQQVLAPRVLNLNEVVAETDKMLRRLIGEDIRLTTTLASTPWAVLADAGGIEQVLLNLAVNARDAMPKGGQLTIETHNVNLDETYVRSQKDACAGPHVLLSVADTGCGISPEVMAKIFEPFFTTKEPGKGTGLGLATVYGIVKQSGGHIGVYSEVGHGTTFKVYLPRVEQAATDSKAPSRILTPPRGTETILLAEDEAGVRTLARYILTECGYKVLQAADGEEAMRVAAAHDGSIHLLITDVVMPGMGGRAVAEHLTERHPGVRVLFISGYTDDAVIRHGVLREGMNFLQKPFTPIAMALKVRDVLDGP